MNNTIESIKRKLKSNNEKQNETEQQLNKKSKLEEPQEEEKLSILKFQQLEVCSFDPPHDKCFTFVVLNFFVYMLEKTSTCS